MILLITILGVAIYHISKKQNIEYIPKNIEASINYFNSYVLNHTDEFRNYFKDRYVTINNACISIGKNKNELDNGYYDINLKLKEKSIEIYVNKLFKEFDIDTICDEIYVNELIEYITKILNLKIDKKQFSQIIINNYEIIRDVDRNSVENVDKALEINDISITITVYQNILVLKMGDK